MKARNCRKKLFITTFVNKCLLHLWTLKLLHLWTNVYYICGFLLHLWTLVTTFVDITTSVDVTTFVGATSLRFENVFWLFQTWWKPISLRNFSSCWQKPFLINLFAWYEILIRLLALEFMMCIQKPIINFRHEIYSG